MGITVQQVFIFMVTLVVAGAFGFAVGLVCNSLFGPSGLIVSVPLSLIGGGVMGKLGADAALSLDRY